MLWGPLGVLRPRVEYLFFGGGVRGNAVGAAGERSPIVGHPLGRTETPKNLNRFE